MWPKVRSVCLDPAGSWQTIMMPPSHFPLRPPPRRGRSRPRCRRTGSTPRASGPSSGCVCGAARRSAPRPGSCWSTPSPRRWRTRTPRPSAGSGSRRCLAPSHSPGAVCRPLRIPSWLQARSRRVLVCKVSFMDSKDCVGIPQTRSQGDGEVERPHPNWWWPRPHLDGSPSHPPECQALGQKCPSALAERFLGDVWGTRPPSARAFTHVPGDSSLLSLSASLFLRPGTFA